MKNYEANVEGQLELLSVKELNEKRVPAQRINIAHTGSLYTSIVHP